MIGAVLLVAASCVGTVGAQENPRFTPSTRGIRPEVTRWEALVAQYDWDVPTMLRIIDCESEGNPWAENPHSGAKGLTQLYKWDWTARRLFGFENLFDPEQNIAFAYYLFEDSGRRFGWHWHSSRFCWQS